MRRLIVLRPEPGSSETVERAHRLGLEAVAMPLFEVEPLKWDVPEAGRFDALLLTSANAVRHGGEGLQQLRGLPVHAVGEATAAAARSAGFDIASVGDSDIERLLGSIEADLRLLHLCGEHRTAVDARQPMVAVTVYRSAELPAPEGLRRIEGQTVAAHSSRAASRLAQLVGSLGIDRGTIRIAAISEAVAEASGSGWERIEAAGRPSDDALLALAARLCDKPGA